MNQILGGWRLGGIITYQSGFYFTPESFFDPAYSPKTYGNAHAEVINNPYDFSYGRDVQAADGCPVGHQSVNCWFNPAGFTLAPPGQYGKAGRNSLLGPDLIEVDGSLFKVFPLTESKRFEFQAEFFNLPNRPIFPRPSSLSTEAVSALLLALSTTREISNSHCDLFSDTPLMNGT